MGLIIDQFREAGYPFLMTKQAATLLLLLLPFSALADEAVDACIEQWGKASPFKKGAKPHQVVGTSVKVLGIGKDNFEDLTATKGPRLVVIKPSVNVLGKTVFRLMNPNGWYCFKSNTSVLGKIQIEAACTAKIASSKDGGANVLGSDESDQGVTVLGTLRITRPGCEGKEAAEKTVKRAPKEEEEAVEALPSEPKASPKVETKVVTMTVTATATGTATGTGTKN